MRIGFVGAGMIGHALAVRLATAGHEVMLSNSRGPDTLAEVVGSIQGTVRAGTVAQAARFGEVVFVAIPVGAIRSLPPEPFARKLVVDANNYYPEQGGHVAELDTDETTSSELLASRLPRATVVKPFNTIHFRRLLEESRPELPAEQRRSQSSLRRYFTARMSIGRMSGSTASRSAPTAASAFGISPSMCAWRASTVSKVSKMP